MTYRDATLLALACAALGIGLGLLSRVLFN
jgi:hypothetical protein